MTIKQQGGVFGRNPTFNNVEVNTITADGNAFVKALGVNTTSLTSISGFGFGSFSGSNGGGIVLQQNGTPKASIASFGNDQYIDAVGKTVIRTGATVTGAPVNVMEFQADRNVKMSAGNLIFLAGKGIDFSATSGTGTSELFDDYEEGTWTPASATNCTVNSVPSAFYTKIGRMVHCYCYVNITTTGLNFTIAGLPYVCTNGFGPASLYYLTGGGSASIYGSQQNYVNNGSSDLKLGLGATVTGALVMLTASYYN